MRTRDAVVGPWRNAGQPAATSLDDRLTGSTRAVEPVGNGPRRGFGQNTAGSCKLSLEIVFETRSSATRQLASVWTISGGHWS